MAAIHDPNSFYIDEFYITFGIVWLHNSLDVGGGQFFSKAFRSENCPKSYNLTKCPKCT